MHKYEIEGLVCGTLRELAEALQIDTPHEISLETVVFGPGGLLDSMGLVAFIADLEERVEDMFGEPLILASERAMSRSRSPFRTVRTVADYISELLAGRSVSA